MERGKLIEGEGVGDGADVGLEVGGGVWEVGCWEVEVGVGLEVDSGG